LYDSRVLSIRDLSKAYDGPRKRLVLVGVNLELATGEYVAVMGESGIGKSTLLNLIAGLERPDAGTIEIDGADLARLDDEALTRLRGERMGFVFQAFHILPYLSVFQNVELPLRLQHAPEGDARIRTMQMLKSVGLADRAGSMPRELSGGELQRVAIARALAHRPKLVLADEPTGNLDPDSARQVLDLLRSQIKENNAAGILVTHSQLAAQTADRVLRLSARGLQGIDAAPLGRAG
jgi:putative ABC transport system ATP-binding protein